MRKSYILLSALPPLLAASASQCEPGWKEKEDAIRKSHEYDPSAPHKWAGIVLDSGQYCAVDPLKLSSSEQKRCAEIAAHGVGDNGISDVVDMCPSQPGVQPMGC